MEKQKGMTKREAQEWLNKLSPRELEVLGGLAASEKSEPLAKRLRMSPLTLRTHVQNFLRKLNLHSRLDAVVLFYLAAKG